MSFQELFYLPSYSPQLNLMGILWQSVKYQWIDCSAYNSFHNLVAYVDNFIRLYRTDYQINFVKTDTATVTARWATGASVG